MTISVVLWMLFTGRFAENDNWLKLILKRSENPLCFCHLHQVARKNAQTFAIKHGSLDGKVNVLNVIVCLVGCFFPTIKQKVFDDRLLQEVTSMEMSQKKKCRPKKSFLNV